MTVVSDARYPLRRPDEDPKLTFGLIREVAAVLADHGYPPIDNGADHVRLQQMLFGFLYSEDRPWG